MAIADTVVSLGVLISIYTLLALGMNVKYGYAGLLDFGHVAFYLVGAYTAALFVLPPESPQFTDYVFGLDAPWLVAIAVATVVAGLFGGLVALPTIRLREDYLAIALLGVSVILQRIVQAESWLVNGPDALRGYQQPMKTPFPIQGTTTEEAIIFGTLAFAVWMATVAGLLTLYRSREGGLRGRVVEALTVGATFGLVRALDAESTKGRARVAALAGAVAGVLSAASLFAVPVDLFAGATALLLVATVVSLLTWVVGLLAVRAYSSELTVTDYLSALGIGIAFFVVLSPIPLTGGSNLGILLTLAFFGAFVYGLYSLNDDWDRFRANRFTVLVVAGLWALAIWYFVIPISGPLRAGAFGEVGEEIFESLVWFLTFSNGEAVVRYSRFLLVTMGALTFGSYYLMELTVESPFGRMLRAIRNDETIVNALGKSPFMYKIQGMVLGSALGGLAGALAAMYYQGLVFTMFSPRITFIALLIMFLGGAGNNRAMVVGAAIFWGFHTATAELTVFFPTGLREHVQAFRLVVLGLLFLAVLYYRPQGLLGSKTAAEVGSE
jgi:ABC-type branched-subunit amino acid transport system permease subunit